MEIINLKQEHAFILSRNIGFNFVIRMQQSGQVWLLNCSEGCQHNLARKKIRIGQITKIIVTDLRIQHISGLLGLLSSLSLNTAIEKIDIYGPKGLVNYLFLGRQYSRTNFRYTLSIHNVGTGLIFQSRLCQLYAFKNLSSVLSFDYFILISESPGRFNLPQAIKHSIPLGYLYGELKIGNDFILPDGFILYGNSFINGYYLGAKFSFLLNYAKRQNFELAKNSRAMFYN